jgi:uncharacterized repeat protein (TIGR03843 family)
MTSADQPATPPEQAPALLDGVLSGGDIEIKGRVLPASNITFFGEATVDGTSVRCVYKPIAGERPLWDFPDGTLAAREVAAYVVSEALGWGIVPRTLMREGPAGVGMVQEWRDPDESQDPVDIVKVDAIPPGYLHVLDAIDGDGTQVSLVHEDTAALRRMAVFDAIVNNADRKGGHVLAMSDGHRFGVDHGVCFHVDDKLRTILWGWAGSSLHPDDAAAVAGLAEVLESPGAQVLERLDELLAPHEVDAFRARADRLLGGQRMPVPSGEWPAIPWPAF